MGKSSGGEAVSGVVVKGKLAQGKGSGIMLIAKERPGVYWDYDASGVLWGSDSLKQVGIAALCEKR